MSLFSKKPADRCSEFQSRCRKQIEDHKAADAKLDAEQRRIAIAREKARVETMESARAEAEGAVASLVSQACDRLKQTADALDTLGSEPTEPSLDRVREADLDTYLAEQAKFAAALPAHRESVRLISRPLTHALKGLHHEAGLVKNEVRSLGLDSLEGAGLLSEWHRALRPCPVNGCQQDPDRAVELICVLALKGLLTAAHCRSLADFLAMPEPETQVSNPTYPHGYKRRVAPAAATAWKRVEQALAGPAAAQQTQGDKDAQRYVDAVGAGTQRPIGERFKDDGKRS